uniref:Uncharacterized protein n=1 Tax=Arundo donax TaxID=35708 RepID=A0A0A9A0Y8_ARUDO
MGNKIRYPPEMMISIWKNNIRKVVPFSMAEMTLKTISLKKKKQNPPNRKRQSQQQGWGTMRRMPTQRQKLRKLRKL